MKGLGKKIMKTPMTIGARIAYIRRVKNMKQTELCSALDITQSYLSRVEGDKDKPSTALLSAIAYQLSIPVDWLEHGGCNTVHNTSIT